MVKTKRKSRNLNEFVPERRFIKTLQCCVRVYRYGIVNPSKATQLRPMLFRCPSRRVLKTAGSALLLWLVSASAGFAEGAPPPGSKPCDPQTTSIQKLIRQARAVGGPIAKHVRKKLTRKTVRTTHVERGVRAPAADDGQAIQNDAPAAHAAVPPVHELRALGIFDDPLERLPLTISSSEEVSG